MEFINRIFTFLYHHPEVTWSGAGLFILTSIWGIFKLLYKWFNIRYKIASRRDDISNNELENDLEFDVDNGIYFKINSKGQKELFCPRCLDIDKNLMHLEVNKYSDGNLFDCKQCNKNFGKGFFNSITPEDDSITNFLNWNG